MSPPRSRARHAWPLPKSRVRCCPLSEVCLPRYGVHGQQRALSPAATRAERAMRSDAHARARLCLVRLARGIPSL